MNHDLDSWAVDVDMRVPLDPHFILRGEGYVGNNLVPFMGGIVQGAAAIGTIPALTDIRGIGDAGGWLETIIPMNSGKDTLYFGAGKDDPKNSDLLPGTTRSLNGFLWGSYFRKITKEVTAALEWSYWDFQTITFVNNQPTREAKGPTGTAHVVNASIAYQF